jgi:hypothetical protein
VHECDASESPRRQCALAHAVIIDEEAAPEPRLVVRSARLALPSAFPLATPAVPRALDLVFLASRFTALLQTSFCALLNAASDSSHSSPSESNAVDSVMTDRASAAMKLLIDIWCLR